MKSNKKSDFLSEYSSDEYIGTADDAAGSLKISFLGGINEVGKNMTCFEYGDDMIILDCGLKFPDATLPGIDIVIPDFSYITETKKNIRALIITHGHEDHIGGIAYLFKERKIPVYATSLTMALIESKLAEHDLLDNAELNAIAPGETICAGEFTVEAIHVNHSIPDAIAVAIRCGAGTVVHTGDFKIDSTPIDGEPIDIARFAEIGREGVVCMLADSTNAERPGYTQSESTVGESLESIIASEPDKRIIVATFASNIHRIQQIINISRKIGRKVALSGRSLENDVKIAIDLGYMDVPDGTLISINQIKEYTPSQLTIITTGSQGEPMSALTKMAGGTHPKVKIGPTDVIIISATPIPGNEKTVGNVIDNIYRLGANVIYSKMYDVHVSGHACQEELKLMMNIIKPKYFIPVHGEQKQLRAHASVAENLGIPKENIFIADNGFSIYLNEKEARVSAPVRAGRTLIDGKGIGDIGSTILKDRLALGDNGVVSIGLVIDSQDFTVYSEPMIESKGFTYFAENDNFAQTICDRVRFIAENSNYSTVSGLKQKIIDEISRVIYGKFQRSPVIIPLVIEV